MPRDIDLPDCVKSLSAEVAAAMAAMEPSVTQTGLQLYPCEVVLDDGAIERHVYLVEARGYLREWGVWPWEDRGKRWIPAERVRTARSSPARLPARFANELYGAGESGMGYCAFSVELSDGRRLHYVTGNAVDFPAWPENVTPPDIVAVHPHDRGEAFRARNPRASESSADYAWCPFRVDA